jgi:hypothetical protein
MAISGHTFRMADPQQQPSDVTNGDKQRDDDSKGPSKRPGEPKKSGQMRDADVSNGESP